jgi:hypothetical protein
MQKVYLLLRSNKQTGPYSLEELLELKLKPFDLVWVDGRSAAWQYPSEVPALKQYVAETPQADAPFQPIATAAMEEGISNFSGVEPPTPPQNPNPQKAEIPKRVFVSVPKTQPSTNEKKNFESQNSFQEHKAYMPPVSEPVYERKDEVKTVTASYSQTYQHPKPSDDSAIHTNYSRPLQEVEEEYTNWTYRQKTKKKPSVNPKDLALAALIIVVIVGGYYVMSKPSVANSVLPTNKIVSQTNQQPGEMVSEETKNQETLLDQQNTPVEPSSNATNNIETKQSKNIKTKNHITVSPNQTNSSVPETQNSMPVEKTNPNIHDNNEAAVMQTGERQQPKQTAPAEKKKKLGEVLKGIFSKKEKKEEASSDAPVLEDPKPANNRQATRRDEADKPDVHSGANEISTASLMEQVDLSSNAPDNWMMGVKNLKITLKNRSNVTIQAASVSVSYYNENNELLEKKLIYFSNVAPGSKASAAAPDHKFADHVDFKLTTVTAKEDRYARY